VHEGSRRLLEGRRGAALAVGDARDPANAIGAVINARAEKILECVESGGASWMWRGGASVRRKVLRPFPVAGGRPGPPRARKSLARPRVLKSDFGEGVAVPALPVRPDRLAIRATCVAPRAANGKLCMTCI
jgi:hypothetical protein